ncbi:alternate-type signal peptide domain-containing protein [Arsenicicoccus sp. MKL-02]|uniref:Alternate-type signal peptide domain-containing protein n=1 Tax=Arsenicicoccus cauae TaxID=2663847 RepID=A0A6I3IIC5_9MICO|nr:alternate-type signal peptide domain-containing protein [Arsenicicoccus cauae]MTB71405.1 alternate-type signal peptide domain-containing protein [Arsenicicoccus cauae]
MTSTAITTAPARSNRTKKALVAGALGVALLAGGGGTFASWYENTTIGSGAVSAGHLNWTVGTAAWTDQTGKTIDPATFKMVPGDTVTYKTTVTTDLVGTNLKANLALDNSTLTGTMKDFVTTTTAISKGGTAIANPLTPATNGTYDVVVTITLPYAAANGTDAENTSLDLSAIKLSLTQVQ